MATSATLTQVSRGRDEDIIYMHRLTKEGMETSAPYTGLQRKEWRHQLLTQVCRGRNGDISSLHKLAEEGMETLAPYIGWHKRELLSQFST
jgi:hypothetical protein